MFFECLNQHHCLAILMTSMTLYAFRAAYIWSLEKEKFTVTMGRSAHLHLHAILLSPRHLSSMTFLNGTTSIHRAIYFTAMFPKSGDRETDGFILLNWPNRSLTHQRQVSEIAPSTEHRLFTALHLTSHAFVAKQTLGSPSTVLLLPHPNISSILGWTTAASSNESLASNTSPA